MLSTLFAIGLLLSAWAFWMEPRQIATVRANLALPGWQAERTGLRVAILTDLHVGSPHNGLAKLEEIVVRTNAESADLVVLLGDYVIDDVLGGDFVPPEATARVLQGLEAPLGVYAVLGNHDCTFDAPRVAHSLEAVGIPVLEDEAIHLQIDDSGFWIVGLKDLSTRETDVDAALAAVGGTDPVLLLSHNPAAFARVPERVSLTLSGHTHGGQVDFPVFGRAALRSRGGHRYPRGHYVEAGRHLFVSSGVGTSVVPARFRVPPEIAVLTLDAQESGRLVAAN